MNILKRQLLFVLLCLPLRLLIALLPIYLNKLLKKIYSFLIFTIGITFLYLYFTNSRLDAFESGGKTWWHNIRLIHGMLFLTSSIYLYNNSNLASFIMLIDIFIGFIVFLNNHFLKF